jgi:uncharacterized membrane protein
MFVDPAGASRENSRRDGSLTSLGLGFVSGLRTFTPVAAVMLVRGGIWGIVLAVAAVGEYVVDVLPNTPSRTQARGLSARVVSGAFVGWMIATMHDSSGMFGAIAGIAGAVIGTHAGHASRSDRPYRRLSCRDRGRLHRDRTRSFHRHTLGPACILTPRITVRCKTGTEIQAKQPRLVRKARAVGIGSNRARLFNVTTITVS